MVFSLSGGVSPEKIRTVPPTSVTIASAWSTAWTIPLGPPCSKNWTACPARGLISVVSVQVTPHEPLFNQIPHDLPRILFWGTICRGQRDLGSNWFLVGIINAGKVCDFPPPRLGVHALSVALLAYLERGVYEHFHETAFADHVAHLIPRRTVWTYRRACHSSAMSHNLRCDKTDAPDVGVPIF